MASSPNRPLNIRTAPSRFKIQAYDRIWHLNFNEPAVQNYMLGPALVLDTWFAYEIVVKRDDYTVVLTNPITGERIQTTSFHNTDNGRSPGFLGVQVYSGNTVARRHIRIKAL